MSEIENTPGTLYVVATPIGHLDDLTRRAEHILKQVQIVAAEDTRRTAVLLDRIDHRAPELMSYHEHNKHKVTKVLIDRLIEGADVALVSDAGTPLINDPGAELVAAAHQAGVSSVPIPGASALTAALSVCPFPCYPFRYLGFLPSKAGARRKVLSRELEGGDALVFFEAPHRIAACLTDLAAGTVRRVMVARELTKKFETITTVAADQLVSVDIEPRGEFVVVVEGNQDVSVDDQEAARVISSLLAYLAPSQAAKCGAEILRRKKSDMYQLAQRLHHRDD